MIRMLTLAAGIALVATTATAAEFPFARLGYDEAVALANKLDRRLLVEVYTVWCGPCKRLEKDVFGSQEMQSLADRMVAIRIDGESPEGVAFNKQFGVERYPTTIFMTPQGAEETRIVGFRELPGFMHVVKRWVDGKLQDSDRPQPPGETVAARDAPQAIEQRFAAAFDQAWAGTPQAEAALRAVLAEDPENKRGVGALALLAIGEWVQLRRAKDAKAAAATLEEVTRRFAKTHAADQAVYPLAQALAQQGKQAAALTLLERRASSRGDLDAWFHLTWFCASTADVDPKSCVRKAAPGVARHPQSAELLEALAALQIRAGDGRAAAALLDRAIELRPEHPWYAQRKAQLLRAGTD